MEPLSFDAEDALELALDAAEAIEEAGRSFGPNSEEARLARAAYEQWQGEYRELTKDRRCRHCACPN